MITKTCQHPGCSAEVVIKSEHATPRFCPTCKLKRKKTQDKQFRIDNPDYHKNYSRDWKAKLKKQEENFYKTLSRKAQANMVTTTTEKLKYPAEVVRPISEEIIKKLAPHCERIEGAGSLKRGKSEIGDIEIVCIPNKIIVTDDLFTSHAENCTGFVQAVDQFTKVKGDARLGKYMQRVHPSGIKIDIFTAEPDTWGYILMLRTGPADFSKGMVVELRKHGLVGENGAIYNQATKKRIPCPEEEDFFSLVKIKYIHPRWRI